jgi:hypothetical protein
MRGRPQELSGASLGSSRFATTVVTTVGAEAPSLHRTTSVPCCRCGLLSHTDSRKLWFWPRSRGRSSNETCGQPGGVVLGANGVGCKQRAGALAQEMCQEWTGLVQSHLLDHDYSYPGTSQSMNMHSRCQ